MPIFKRRFCLYFWKYFIIIYTLFCFNPVDTRCRFNVYSTSVRRRWNGVVCLQGSGFIMCHRQSLGKLSWFAPKSKRSLKFNPLKVHQLSPFHIVVLLCRHGFPWKKYNFHQLKDVFREYSIKRMKELLSWLLYPTGCGST